MRHGTPATPRRRRQRRSRRRRAWATWRACLWTAFRPLPTAAVQTTLLSSTREPRRPPRCPRCLARSTRPIPCLRTHRRRGQPLRRMAPPIRSGSGCQRRQRPPTRNRSSRAVHRSRRAQRRHPTARRTPRRRPPRSAALRPRPCQWPTSRRATGRLTPPRCAAYSARPRAAAPSTCACLTRGARGARWPSAWRTARASSCACPSWRMWAPC